MTDSTPTGQGARSVAALHGAITIGLVALVSVIIGLLWLGTAPLLPASQRPEWLGALVACMGVVPIVLGLAIFRARVPDRAVSESTEEYWRHREHIGAALVLWVLLEGGGALGAVGLLLTGDNLPAVVPALALAALVFNGPGRLASSTS